jgi:hypothetical protein
MAFARPSDSTASIPPHVSLNGIAVSRRNITRGAQQAAPACRAPYGHVGKNLAVGHWGALLKRPLGGVALFKGHEADRTCIGVVGGSWERGGGGGAREGNGEVDEEEVDVVELKRVGT